ncbi:MAG: PEP-CTERM sorting domain-containing protein [Phycisphaerae bacterium]
MTNITETNDTASDSYYGPGSLTGTVLSFPVMGTLPFKVASSGAGDSDFIDVKLSFDVSAPNGVTPAAFLSEVGDYFATGTGTGGDSASLLIFGNNTALIGSGTSNYTPAPGTTSAVWTNSVGASAAGVPSLPSFHVVIDNILHTATVAPVDFALIEKKGLSVDIGTSSGGGPGTPEPASLGLLGLGAIALVGRRRKA